MPLCCGCDLGRRKQSSVVENRAVDPRLGDGLCWRPQPTHHHMRSLGSLLALSVLASSGLPAAVVLTVDISDPTNVTLSATGNSPLLDNSSFTTYDGITLLSFFRSAQSGSVNATSSTLTPNGTSQAYTSVFADNMSTSGGDRVDLNLYADGGTEAQNMSTLVSAFTGSAVVDMSGFSGALPVNGSIGTIHLSFYDSGVGTPGPAIGDYQVIPEPSTWAWFAGLATLALVGWRRRK